MWRHKKNQSFRGLKGRLQAYNLTSPITTKYSLIILIYCICGDLPVHESSTIYGSAHEIQVGFICMLYVIQSTMHDIWKLLPLIFNAYCSIPPHPHPPPPPKKKNNNKKQNKWVVIYVAFALRGVACLHFNVRNCGDVFNAFI